MGLKWKNEQNAKESVYFENKDNNVFKQKEKRIQDQRPVTVSMQTFFILNFLKSNKQKRVNSS